jgi:hypothetical protein
MARTEALVLFDLDIQFDMLKAAFRQHPKTYVHRLLISAFLNADVASMPSWFHRPQPQLAPDALQDLILMHFTWQHRPRKAVRITLMD